MLGALVLGQYPNISYCQLKFLFKYPFIETFYQWRKKNGFEKIKAFQIYQNMKFSITQAGLQTWDHFTQPLVWEIFFSINLNFKLSQLLPKNVCVCVLHRAGTGSV